MNRTLCLIEKLYVSNIYKDVIMHKAALRYYLVQHGLLVKWHRHYCKKERA